MLTRRKPSPTPVDRMAERAERLRTAMHLQMEVASRPDIQRAVMRRVDEALQPLPVKPVKAAARLPKSAVDGKHAASQSERDYMGRVAGMPCVVCQLLGQSQTTRTEVHHIREGQGGAQRAGNYLTLPLCTDDHTGPAGVHGDKSRLRLLRVTEIDLLDLTIAQLLTGEPA